jgi:hypothetical protein
MVVTQPSAEDYFVLLLLIAGKGGVYSEAPR